MNSESGDLVVNHICRDDRGDIKPYQIPYGISKMNFVWNNNDSGEQTDMVMCGSITGGVISDYNDTRVMNFIWGWGLGLSTFKQETEIF